MEHDFRKEYHLGIRVDLDTKEDLEKLAVIDGRSRANYGRKVLMDHIEEQRRKGIIK